MKRNLRIIGLVFLLCALSAPSWAASVALVKEDAPPASRVLSDIDGRAIVLTFGDERVVIYEPPLSLPDSELLAEEASLSDLYLLRDYRPVSERTGYDVLYSHSGFILALVQDPQPLTRAERVRLRPITESQVVTRKPKIGKATPDPTVQKVLNLLSATEYRQYMSTLTEGLTSRFSCGTGQLSARDVISNLFTKSGLLTNLSTFTNKCRNSCKNLTGFNVIGVKKGLVRPQEYYLVGAHYDSTSGNPCQIAPGANDNASGMAAVMELARVFSQFNTEASLIFAAFSGEEQGMLGSQKYVQTLINSKQASRIKAFVVLDMISYYNKNRGILIEGSGRTPAQKAAINRLALYGATYTGLKLETTTSYGDSDHEPFLDKGMAGALLIESDWSNYKYYHTSKDQMVYQNIPYALDVVKVAAAMLAQEAKIIK
jgi:hypothetical protein